MDREPPRGLSPEVALANIVEQRVQFDSDEISRIDVRGVRYVF